MSEHGAPRPRRRLLGLLLAVAVPAGAAGGVVLALADDSPPRPLREGSPSGLLEAAAVQGAGSSEKRTPPGERPAPPRTISIPAAEVKAPVDPVAARRGVLKVPAIGRAGWYDGGARPGESGRAVIIGHLDTREGPGLFARVPRLRKGTAVSITDADGVTHRYSVVGGVRVRKERFPAHDVYGGGKARVLVLITCGGPFKKGRGYRDNVLVYARPA